MHAYTHSQDRLCCCCCFSGFDSLPLCLPQHCIALASLSLIQSRLAHADIVSLTLTTATTTRHTLCGTVRTGTEASAKTQKQQQQKQNQPQAHFEQQHQRQRASERAWLVISLLGLQRYSSRGCIKRKRDHLLGHLNHHHDHHHQHCRLPLNSLFLQCTAAALYSTHQHTTTLTHLCSSLQPSSAPSSSSIDVFTSLQTCLPDCLLPASVLLCY